MTSDLAFSILVATADDTIVAFPSREPITRFIGAVVEVSVSLTGVVSRRCCSTHCLLEVSTRRRVFVEGCVSIARRVARSRKSRDAHRQ